MIELVNADTLRIPLADKSVHMALCSPPYWGLRDYGLGEWQGGDPGCNHQGPPKASGKSTLKNDGRPPERVGQNDYERDAFTPYGSTCEKCGATRTNPGIGLEPVHDCLGWTRGENCGECYVCHMRQVAAEVWRVLRDDGTWWVNLGDSYAGAHTTYNGNQAKWQHGDYPGRQEVGRVLGGVGLKPKDLCGIPWRVALALQADGWYLRSDIIWAKPNPMPESVTDRPTKAHEYIFLFSKKARYFYDADAVREESVDPTGTTERYKYTFWENGKHQTGGYSANGAKHTAGMKHLPAGRNRRTVWDIATQPYSGAHFATWPEALVEPMIKAGTSERGCCPICKAPFERVVNKIGKSLSVSERHGRVGHNGQPPQISGMYWTGPTTEATNEWQPTCTHDAAPVPCTVLDPFAGSGTSGVVARRLGRNFVGLDLSYAYLHDQAKERLGITALEQWGQGIVDEQVYDDLPLFGG